MLKTRQKIFIGLTIFVAILYILWILYVLSGPISVMMLAEIFGGGIFFVIPSTALGIWGHLESKQAGISKQKRNLKMFSIAAAVPAIVTIFGLIISFLMILVNPPHVN